MLLPTSYFPPITWIHAIKDESHFRVEAMEHFSKQTIRNRCLIIGTDGIHRLVVPLSKRKDKTISKDIRIDHAQRWQSIHFRTLQACYRRSPWFEFYEDELETFFQRRDEFLIDMNAALLHMIFRWLKMEPEHSLTVEYEKNPSDRDLRTRWDRDTSENKVSIPDYASGSGRQWNADYDTSILDLIFYQGKNTSGILEEIREI